MIQNAEGVKFYISKISAWRYFTGVETRIKLVLRLNSTGNNQMSVIKKLRQDYGF